MNILLSNTEREQLLSSHKKEKDRRIGDRIKVILLSDKNESIEEIARFLFIHPNTVLRHINEYKANKKIKPNSSTGAPSKLTIKDAQELKFHIENNIYISSNDIINYVYKKYGKKYTISGMTDWLNTNGFTYKKPKSIPSKFSEEKQKEFISMYKDLESNLSEGEEILFIDSCHPTQNTKFSYGWIKKGEEKQIKTSASRTRLNITGAINIKSKKVITGRYETINSKSTKDFLEKVLLSYPKAKKINIIADGASYHKSKDVEGFLKGKNIKMHILPPYSPNLNPIERLWKIMNEFTRNNRYFENAKSFRASIDNFFNITIPSITEILQKRINSNFQIIKN